MGISPAKRDLASPDNWALAKGGVYFSKSQKMNRSELGRADLHVHTLASDGIRSPEECVRLANELELDVLAITDHDRVLGALIALEEAEKMGYSVSVVPGTEITTCQGHLLALYVKEEIPSMYSLIETVGEIHCRGGLAIAPHVGLGLSPVSISAKTIARLYQKGEKLDGIEVQNPHYWRRHLEQARLLSLYYGISPVAGSDDHFGNFGREVQTLFLGKTAADLRTSIEQGTTLAVRSDLPLRKISVNERIFQLTRGLTDDVPRKAKRSHIFVSNLLRPEELKDKIQS